MKQISTIHRYAAAILLSILSGCSSVQSRIAIGNIPDNGDIHKSRTFDLVKVHVMKFRGSRTNDAITEVDGVDVKAEDDVGGIVQEALEHAFRESGAQLAAFDSAAVSGDVTEWTVDITKEFPLSTIEGQAAIRVLVMDKTGNVVYTGEYSGSTSTKYPMVTESKIREVLTAAMGYAINEAVRDSRVIDKLNQYSG